LLERAVEIRARTYGIHHPETLASIKLLGTSFARLGQLRRAKDLYQLVADEQSKLVNKGTDLAQTASSLAEVSLGLGEVDVAKEQYRRAIEIQKKVSGDDHAEMARPLVGLAMVHEHCKEIKEAKTLLEKALVIYRKSVSNHSKVLITEMHLKRIIAKLPQPRCSVM
jgi:tetratricopeptide (TPR) repeat protein